MKTKWKVTNDLLAISYYRALSFLALQDNRLYGKIRVNGPFSDFTLNVFMS